MKKYRLKVQMLHIQPGAIFEFCKNGYVHKLNSHDYVGLPRETVEETSFFEEIEERWKPVRGAMYWFICTNGDIADDIRFKNNDNDELLANRYEFGNCFKSESEAIAARDRIKTMLINFHRENK